jgi:hypothetical protein
VTHLISDARAGSSNLPCACQMHRSIFSTFVPCTAFSRLQYALKAAQRFHDILQDHGAAQVGGLVGNASQLRAACQSKSERHFFSSRLRKQHPTLAVRDMAPSTSTNKSPSVYILHFGPVCVKDCCSTRRREQVSKPTPQSDNCAVLLSLRCCLPPLKFAEDDHESLE